MLHAGDSGMLYVGMRVGCIDAERLLRFRFGAAEQSILKMVDLLHQPPLEPTDIASSSIDRVQATVQDYHSHSSPPKARLAQHRPECRLH